ncbi:MAG: hypothetical protein P4N24_14290, partial [Acidobacteriota bacterium]|nr:hypothetical protein [Acidobacteriota bacterium]
LDRDLIMMGTGSDKGGVEPPHSKALRALSLHAVPIPLAPLRLLITGLVAARPRCAAILAPAMQGLQKLLCWMRFPLQHHPGWCGLLPLACTPGQLCFQQTIQSYRRWGWR